VKQAKRKSRNIIIFIKRNWSLKGAEEEESISRILAVIMEKTQ
jgi:hypothetical protein